MRSQVGRFAVLAASLALGAALLSACVPAATSGTDPNRTPVRGYTALSPQRLAGYVAFTYWVNGGRIGGCGTTAPYRATVGIETLASFYVIEGNAQRIRGDLAFVQSILETGWFSFPNCGLVRGSDNNFAGIGATGSRDNVNRFPKAQKGVRAQMQRLHNYADRHASAWRLGKPFVPQRLMWTHHEYDVFFNNGVADTWQRLTGRWATSPCYDTKVLRLYNNMRAHYGMARVPARVVSGC